MIKIVLLVTTALYPHKVASEVAKKNIEMATKYPPAPDIGETVIMGARATKKGITVLAVYNVKKGKMEEALIRLTMQYQEFVASIEGFKWHVKTFMTVAEAYKAVGMEAPG